MKNFKQISVSDTPIAIIKDLFDVDIKKLPPNSVVYGGAVRDLVAGMPIEGDLDVAISKTIEESCKVDTIENYELIYNLLQSLGYTSEESMYYSTFYEGIIKHNKEAIFKKGNKVVHVISVIGDPNKIASEVDFHCCGLIIDRKGNIFEVLKGAAKDCREKVLRLNEKAVIKNLKKRVDKLQARGWTFKI